MIKTSIKLQDLRGRIYTKAKTDKLSKASAGYGGVRTVFRKHAHADRSHNP